MDLRKSLRTKMRSARQALSTPQQLTAGEALLNQLLALPAFIQADSIALYLASDGEIDPALIIDYCWQQNKKVFLPVLDPAKHHHLLFIHYLPDTAMCLNKYAIREPATPYRQTIEPCQLDLVLLPLVAFDHSGARMGMGGGYYDRSFAFKAAPEQANRNPLLLGLAHQLQQVTKLKVASWDIPLAGIVTDKKYYAVAEGA